MSGVWRRVIRGIPQFSMPNLVCSPSELEHSPRPTLKGPYTLDQSGSWKREIQMRVRLCKYAAIGGVAFVLFNQLV